MKGDLSWSEGFLFTLAVCSLQAFPRSSGHCAEAEVAQEGH